MALISSLRRTLLALTVCFGITQCTRPLPEKVDIESYARVALLGIPATVTGVFVWSTDFTDHEIDDDDYEDLEYEIRLGDKVVHRDTVQMIDANGLLIPEAQFGPFTLNDSGLKSMEIVLIGRDQEGVLLERSSEFSVRAMHGVLTLIPLALVLIIAFSTHLVLPALWIGCFMASTINHGWNPFSGFLTTLDRHLLHALTDPDHVKILLFLQFLNGMVSVIIRGGGAQGLANVLSKVINSRWSAQWVAYLFGWIIFFDDYASCLLVGANVRMVSDDVHLSHEKLAFIVHVTAAGPAALAPISSWIGMEVGLIKQYLPASLSHRDPFEVFLATIPTRLFPLYLLALIPILLIFKKDFGPLLYAERRAHKLGKVVEDEDIPLLNNDSEDAKAKEGVTPKYLNAAIPMLSMIAIIVISLFLTGYIEVMRKHEEEGLELDFSAANIAGNAESFS